MKRRSLLLSTMLPLVLVSEARAATGIQVVYVGGWDCPYCQKWKTDSKPPWLQSPEFKQVTYTEVESPKLREAYGAQYWKGDLRSVLEQLPTKSGTPRFLIVKEGKVVSNQFGDSRAWGRTYADLQKLL